MKLRDLQWTPTVLTLRRPVQNARAAFHERRGLFLRLTDGDDRCGHGEVTPLSEFGTESMASSLAKLEEAKPRLAGQSIPETVEGVEEFLAEIGNWTAAPAGRVGLGLSLLDLAARARVL